MTRKRILIPIVESFSDEWVEKNPWMDEANKEAQETAPKPLCMFINFPNGVPIPKLRKEWERIVEWENNQEENLAIFHEMMKEKNIKPGMGSIGEKHKGWGNSRQK